MDSLITIPLCIYLALTIRKSGGLYALLKLILLVHVAGDFLSNGYWETANTEYAFMREVTDEMRLQGNLLLWAGVIISDLSYFGVGSLLAETKNCIGFQGKERFTTAKGFGLFLLGVAAAIKIFIGINIGFFYVVPADTVGYFALYNIANTLIPIGAGALFGLNFLPAALVFLLAAIFSYSKAQALIFFVAYGVFCSYGYGYRAVMQRTFSINMLLVVAAIVAAIGFKTATRGGESNDPIGTDQLVENAVLAIDARFMGGIHRTYLTVVDEIASGRMDTMEGKYHLQTLYLWVPRSIWPEKPTIASNELRDYLHVEGDDNQTSYAINPYGFLVVDFGLIGAIFGAIFLGLALRITESAIVSFVSAKSKSTEWQIFTASVITSWVVAAQPLSEGGLPPTIMNLLISFAACFTGYYLYAGIRDLANRAATVSSHDGAAN